MPVESHKIHVETQGDTHVVDITPKLIEVLHLSDVTNGIALLFVLGSTAGITTTEFEPGLATHDLKQGFERIAPTDGHYKHEETWKDDNGHSHVRASVLGPSLTVPINDRKPMLGTWQQIVLVDFDTKPRQRTIVVQIMGE